jgi:hypothetical protein
MSSPSDAIASIVDPEVQAYLTGLAPDEGALLDALEACAVERVSLDGCGSGL